jgi:eukaryotic-like serine/threonine-protein kinase
MQSKFGRYLILKKIAVGGMAEIFLARRISIGNFSKFIVLKRLAPEYQGKKSFERLFLNEARLTARLSHSNIVQMYDIGKVDGAYFMAMEYIHGVSSAEMMSKAAQKRKPVPLGVALGITLAISKALSYCGQMISYEGESLDILHHDVSPHNVQIRFDGEVKLLDFGVATQNTPHESGGRRGKFAYMSPEAFNKRALDQRSDLFSLAVILYELTMGKRLFKGRSQQETRQKAEACLVPIPSEIHPKFPKVLEALLLKALAKDRDHRFLEVDAFSKAIEDCIYKLKLDASPHKIARYLNDLYGDEIEERSLQLQSLATQSEALGDKALDEFNTIDPSEYPPLNLSQEQIPGLPHINDVAPIMTDQNPSPAHEAIDDPLFEAEFIDQEVKEEIIAEPTPSPIEIPQNQHLPKDFTLIAQQEQDWDDGRLMIQGQRRFILFLVIMLIVGCGMSFYFGQSWNYQTSGSSVKSVVQLEIESTPSSAKVLVNGEFLGATPLKHAFPLRKDGDLEVQIMKAGYKNQQKTYQVQLGQSLIIHSDLPANE